MGTSSGRPNTENRFKQIFVRRRTVSFFLRDRSTPFIHRNVMSIIS